MRKLLEDEDNRVQRAACRALTEAGDEEVLPILREMAYSPNPFLRPRAVEGLATLDPEGSREILIELIHDNNIAVRSAAIEALAPYSAEPKVRAALEEAREREITERLRERLEELLAG